MSDRAQQAVVRDGYRLCACAMVFNERGQLLMGHRIRSAPDEGWQCPQGGFDAGESPEQAAQRELHEELGVRSVELLGTGAEPTAYDVQGGWIKREGLRGQLLHFTAFRSTEAQVAAELDLSGTPADPAEFDRVDWVEPARALDLIWDRKRPGYVKALAEFAGKLQLSPDQSSAKK